MKKPLIFYQGLVNNCNRIPQVPALTVTFRSLQSFNDLFYMWETEELLKSSVMNAKENCMPQINWINLNES